MVVMVVMAVQAAPQLLPNISTDSFVNFLNAEADVLEFLCRRFNNCHPAAQQSGRPRNNLNSDGL